MYVCAHNFSNVADLILVVLKMAIKLKCYRQKDKESH